MNGSMGDLTLAVNVALASYYRGGTPRFGMTGATRSTIRRLAKFHLPNLGVPRI